MRTVPRSLIDLLALTVVVEERSFQRYQEHAQRDPTSTKKPWRSCKRSRRTRSGTSPGSTGSSTRWPQQEGGVERVAQAIEKYREIDRQVYGELLAKEQEAFGGTATAPTN